MRHDHKSFDRSDPDASQALDDAIPIVAQILSERAKPQPRDVDLGRAHRAHIAELEDRLRGLALRAGCTVAELEKIAAAKVRRIARHPVQAADGFVLPTGRLPNTFQALAAENQMLAMRQHHLEAEQRRNVAEHRRIVKRAGLVREKLFAWGSANLRGRG